MPFDLTLSNFVKFHAASAAISYTPGMTGDSTFLVGITGVTAFVGESAVGPNGVGAQITNGTLALVEY